MLYLTTYLSGFAVLLTAAILLWLISIPLRNVAIVDGMWSLFFLAAGLSYALYSAGADASVAAPANFHIMWTWGPRTTLVVLLVMIWALRLSVYITVRNWGHGEDRRYVAIRKHNDPGFEFKSLYLVFLLQAVLAWIISLPLLGAVLSPAPQSLGLLDVLGILLWGVGLFFEGVGDWQLSLFKRDPASKGVVMDRGLWRYTRHPNYFGDFCVWWGLYLIALSGGAWWSFIGPLLMSTLLMRVSGVTLLEKDIGKRRAGYEDYVRRTNAFFPGPPK
jgi:steroid 5-alpha reductase family enzyme